MCICEIAVWLFEFSASDRQKPVPIIRHFRERTIFVIISLSFWPPSLLIYPSFLPLTKIRIVCSHRLSVIVPCLKFGVFSCLDKSILFLLLMLGAKNQVLYPQFSLLHGVCIWGKTHLLTRNDIILLVSSQSDASTWSPAFRGVLCTQERQREKEKDEDR